MLILQLLPFTITARGFWGSLNLGWGSLNLGWGSLNLGWGSLNLGTQ